MNFFIKFILLLTLTGCSSLDFVRFDKYFEKEKIPTIDYVDNKLSLYIYFSKRDFEKYNLIDKNKNKNETISWQSKNQLKIITNNIKIVKTIGFENDFEILKYKPINYSELNEESFTSLIKFSDPQTPYMNIIFHRSYQGYVRINDEYLQENSNYHYIKESFEVPLLKWKGHNHYWYSDDKLIKSKQVIYPYKKEVTIYNI
jgi:hypothetical protein